MDAHLEAVPRVGALTARRLAGRDLEVLRRHADRALALERRLLVGRGRLEVSADCEKVKKERGGGGAM